MPLEHGFQFFTESGKYTGITATSMAEFAEKLQIIPIQSVTFHFQHKDFLKWFKNTIGDEELAKRIGQTKARSRDENLRKELSKTVQNHITELTKSSQQISPRFLPDELEMTFIFEHLPSNILKVIMLRPLMILKRSLV